MVDPGGADSTFHIYYTLCLHSDDDLRGILQAVVSTVATPPSITALPSDPGAFSLLGPASRLSAAAVAEYRSRHVALHAALDVLGIPTNERLQVFQVSTSPC